MDTGFGTIVTAAVTPFDANGNVDHDVFRQLLRHLVATGSDSVVVAGTTGESPTLSDAEKLALIQTAVDEIGDKASVIAGTGSNDTAHSIELTRAAIASGVDGVLVVTPYYNKPPREGLLKHFTLVARAAGDAKVMLYNIPGRSVINLEPALIAELAQIPNVVALKQAHDDLTELREIRALAPDLAVYAGDDVSLITMLPEGVVGVVSVASHIVAGPMRDVIERFHHGDVAAAQEMSACLNDVYETLSLTANPIPVKAAMELIGIPVGAPRLPLVPATGMQRERIRAMLVRHEQTVVEHV